MTEFRVWAPKPKQVDLVIAGRAQPMRRVDGDVWQLELPDAGPGTDYGFSLDGGEPLPDPRSGWQPEGVHGPSRVVDHQAFAWSDHGWQAPPLAAAVLYELHVGTFTPAGTFEAVIGRLDHLIDLGVTHVELLPVAEFPGRCGWGYDGVDLFAPHHAYGGPEGLKRLVDACHSHGLAVVLDVVYNHLGPSGNYLSQFGPYFTERYHTPWGAAVNLDDAGSDEVRRFFCDNAKMWLRDYHFDALRIDAVHAFADHSAIHFLEQLGQEVRALGAALGRHLALIAESDLNDPRVVRAPEIGGYGMDAQWSDDFHHALHTALTGETRGYYADFGGLPDLAKAIEGAFVYDGRYAPSRKRRHGRPPEGVPTSRFLAYLQNHDQVGNRARGDRSSHLMSPGKLEIAAALILTSPFVPMLFQGEEWAASTPFQYFTAHDEPELGRAVSEGRRREFAAFGWKPEDVPDPQSPETFARSVLRWDEIDDEQHARILDWHQRLIALRRRTPELGAVAAERAVARFDQGRQWLMVDRGPYSVACNLSKDRQELPVGGTKLDLVLASGSATVFGGQLELEGESVAIVRRG